MGARVMGYLSSYEDLEWKQERVDREFFDIIQGNEVIGTYNIKTNSSEMLNDYVFDFDNNDYVLRDQQTRETFSWANRSEISSFFYQDTEIETVKGWTPDGFGRSVIGIKGTLVPNNKVTIEAGVNLTIVPSPKDLGSLCAFGNMT